MTDPREPWETAAVRRQIPSGATLTTACWHPVPGRALRMAPDDVEGLTREQVRGRLPAGEQVVVSLRASDLDPESEAAVLAIVEATDGGALVVGVTYQLAPGPRALGQACPECGSRDAVVLGPADGHVATELRASAQLFQCRDCGSAWDG
jgi:predicted RNA-binding Zn-ribbon protein involved in translation (DUF1610 family)